jgi:hypothetical protein
MCHTVLMTKEQRNKYMRDRYAGRPDVRQYQTDQVLSRYYCGGWASVQARNQALKVEVLTHYGHEGKLQCCWAGCDVTDVDMLSLDHVKDDGAQHRKHIGATRAYQWAKSHGFPLGVFQTLCQNHQWKKELTRRRQCAILKVGGPHDT